MALSAEQRAGLWRTKLHTLAREHLARPDGVNHPAPWGAALESDGAWTALIEVAPARSFGQALVLAASGGAASLDLLVEHDAGVVARRASLFDPSPTVWSINGSDLESATPAPPTVRPAAEPLEPHIADLLTVAEVDTVVEHGVTMGECRGIEVARVTGAGAEQRLDVGVGAYDQGAFAVMNPELTPRQALADVVAQVLTHRTRGAKPHPLNRLARERWVRSELLADPSQIGLTDLSIVEPIEPRTGVKDVAVASAIGTDEQGERVLVACSVGIDLDAVPAAVDLAAEHGADRVLMMVPERDQHRVVIAVAGMALVPMVFRAPPEPWSA